MRILIDGNDGIGKTTLAKRLQEDLKIVSYIHLTGSDVKTCNFYSQMNLKNNVILDRSFMSEPIYSEVFQRETTLTQEDLDYLYKQIEELDTIVIICHANRSHTKHNEGEYKEVIENRREINKYFIELAKKHDYYLYSPQTSSYERLLDYIHNRNRKGADSI